MSRNMKFGCNADGCTEATPLDYQEFESRVDTKRFGNILVRGYMGLEPKGWAYVQIHRHVARLYCPRHKEQARKNSSENLKVTAQKVKQSVRPVPAKRVARGTR